MAAVAKFRELSLTKSQEHIVGFVDSIDDGGRPVLVMEYVPLGNLTQVEEISKEEMRIVLRQALQALRYLHDEKNITHRDIKPENILVRSRTPEMFIKLCDFGLSKESSFLKTMCGTGLYAAAEIFTGSYTKSVGIWAMGVLGYQFIQGLPAPPQNMEFKKWPKEWSKMWSKKILDTIDHPHRQSDDPAILLLRSMLEPNPIDRPLAKTCLSHPWLQNALPISRPCLQKTNAGPRSLQTISELPTDTRNHQIQLEAEMSAPTPGVLRKRLRSSESITSRTQPPKPGAKKIQTGKSLESAAKGLLADATAEHDGGHRISARPGHATRTPHAEYEWIECTGKALPPPEPETVVEGGSQYMQMKVKNRIVLLRKTDCFLNATQIIRLAEKDDNERKFILYRMKKFTHLDIKEHRSWVNLQHARILCRHLGLERQLQPLLDYAQRFKDDDVERALPIDQDYLSDAGVHPFVAVPAHPEPVMVRILDRKVNANQILKAAGQERQRRTQLEEIKQHHGGDVIVMNGDSMYKGTYVAFDIATGLCQKYGLIELESRIRQVCSNGRILKTTVPSNRIDSEVQPGDIASQTGASLRPDSALPQGWREIQQAGPGPVSRPNDSGPGDDQFQENDPDEGYSNNASKERESERSSFRRGVNTAPSHRRTQHLIREIAPMSSPARILDHESWVYHSQYSHLSRHDLSLKPPDKTSSPYPSFTDYC